MNIFATYDSYSMCAKVLDDKRLVKMVLETTQILCTAVNEAGGVTPYKSTHKNHPCVQWAGYNFANWLWLYDHATSLVAEYHYRFGKEHKCLGVLLKLCWLRDKFPYGERTPFPNCAANKALGISFKDEKNVHTAYKKYLVERWKTDKRKPKWTKREKPVWADSLDLYRTLYE